jgi:hypothetical protein
MTLRNWAFRSKRAAIAVGVARVALSSAAVAVVAFPLTLSADFESATPELRNHSFRVRPNHWLLIRIKKRAGDDIASYTVTGADESRRPDTTGASCARRRSTRCSRVTQGSPWIGFCSLARSTA